VVGLLVGLVDLPLADSVISNHKSMRARETRQVSCGHETIAFVCRTTQLSRAWFGHARRG